MRASKRLAFVFSIVAVLAASAGNAGRAEQGRSAVPQKPDHRAIVHVLNRLGFGVAPGDIDRVRTMGLAAYIDRQLQPEKIDDRAMASRLASLQTLTKSTQEMAEQYYVPAQMARRELQRQQAAINQPPSSDATPSSSDSARRELREMMTPDQLEAVRMERQALTELMQAKILRAAYSDRQLEEVMVDFWFNHFNVFSGKGQVRVYLNEYERDAIRPHVLGSFRALLQATAESPAMLFYLDNWQSAAPEGARTSAPAQNAACQSPQSEPRAPPSGVRPAHRIRHAPSRIFLRRCRSVVAD